MKVLEEENTIYDLTQPPTLLMNTDTSQIYLLPASIHYFDQGTNLSPDKEISYKYNKVNARR